MNVLQKEKIKLQCNHVIITGTSGVGKTHLELELKNKYGFYQLPKYTDRPQRPSETEGDGIYFWSRKKLDTHEDEFFFTLYYTKYRYSWKKKDLEKNKDKNLTIAVTLESLEALTKVIPNFTPILLHVEEKNFSLLRQRIKHKLKYETLDENDKAEADRNINERMKLAKKELNQFPKYKRLVKANNGKVFYIQNDNTLYDEIIPYILAL